MRPLLKWAGGKHRLVPEIAKAFGGPCQGTWVEPFLGSGAVFLALRASGFVGRARLGDANDKLIAVHIAVRDQPDAVLSALGELPAGPTWPDVFARVREAYNEGPTTGPKHAARFMWLNRAAFNGLYRENRKGEFNVPRGSYVTLSLPTAEHVRQASELLQGVELTTMDFGDLMRGVGEGDMIYCDPPYVPLTETASFTGYCRLPFGRAEHIRLAEAARRAGLAGARVVLSNHDLPVVRNELYAVDRGFEHVARPRVARAISRAAASRVSVDEILARIGPTDRSSAA